MKKLFICLIAFCFISCSNGYWTGNWDYNFNNNSSVDISFTVDNYDKTFTLKPSESITLNMNNKDNYYLKNHPRVRTEKSFHAKEGNFDFYDLPYSYINVFNSSQYDIILLESNGLLGENYGDTLLIQAGKSAKTKLYTNTPSYIAVFVDKNIPASLDLLSFY